MKIYGVLHEIKYSIIRAIAERVVELNRKLPPEKRIINLTMGQNYIGNTSFVLERIGMLKSKNMGPFLYAPSLGTFEARESIAKWFYKLWYGVELDLSSVMITDGAMGAIRNAMGAVVRDGDIVVVDPLTFIYVLDTLRVLGRKYRIEVIDGGVDKKNYIPTPSMVIEFLQDLSNKYPDKNIVYYTQFGFNPVGAFRSSSDLKKIVEFIDESRNVFLINDIVYHLIRFGDLENPLASYMSQEGKNIVDCDSLSKPFSLMGLRVGAMITRDREIFEAAAKVQQYTIVSPNILACEVWKVVCDPEIFPMVKVEISKLNTKLKENYELLARSLQSIGFKVISPGEGTLYIFADIGGEDSEKFVYELIEKAGVAVVPGTAFEVKPRIGNRYIRVTISFPREVLEEAVERLEDYFSR